MTASAVSRRQFIQSAAAGAVIVHLPAAFSATIAGHGLSSGLSKSSSPSSLQREFAYPRGAAIIQCWRNGEAELLIEHDQLVLDAAVFGTERLSLADLSSGYAQERIQRVFGVEVAEEAMREFTSYRFQV